MTVTNLVILSAMLSAVAPAVVAAQQISSEIYGGVVLERDEDFDGTLYPIDQGQTFGAAIYVSGTIPNVGFGVDVMSTKALYIGFPGEYISTLSLMAVARYETSITPVLTGYVGGGLGVIRNTYDTGTIVADNVAGGQVSLGLRYDLSDVASVFTEVKHQRGFKDAYFAEYDDTQAYHSNSVLIGYRHNF